MSFLKKLGKSKSQNLESPPDEVNGAVAEPKELKRGKRGSASFNDHKKRDPVKNGDGGADFHEHENGGDLQGAVEKEKERKKYKDMSGLLVSGAPESRAYPTFSVHYLGRIPTSAEYGREAVEEPVDQLCKLREKQKLQRVFLNFNVEGLFCREVSGPFLKTKKDGFNMHIPLHHITYGVACAAHPTVFACIAKMNEDSSPENQVLVLHGFVCDKPETTQAVTYWQLQAYIEAYEDLKRKRILRSRRKQAMGNTSSPGSSFKSKNLNDIPEKGAARSSQHQQEGHRRANERRHSSVTENNNNPSVVHAKEKHRDDNHPTRAGSHHQTGGHHKNPPYITQASADVHGVQHSKTDHKSESKQQPNPDAMRRRSASTGQRSAGQRQSGSPPKQADNPRQSGSPPKQVNNLVRRTTSQQADSSRKRDVRANSVASISSVASSSSGSGNGDVYSSDSPLESPSTVVKGTKTFEKRIGELETLVNMDAEKLKKLMIEDHPTLARRVYYRATVDNSGVFQQGLGLPVDDNVSEA